MKKRWLLRFVPAMLCAAMISLVSCKAGQSFKAGTYTGESTGMGGKLAVSVTLSDKAIESVEITSQDETPGVSDRARAAVPAAIVAEQRTNVDVISGSSITSRAIMQATDAALKSAGVDTAKLNAKNMPKKVAKAEDVDMTTDVVIVGGGGAGLAAAIAATDGGARVIVIEKTGIFGGNSIVSGGIYNCPDPALQDHADIKSSLNPFVEAALAEKPVSPLHAQVQSAVGKQFDAFKKTGKKVFDSPEWFALQTWNGGDKVGDLDHLLVFAAEAYPALEWLNPWVWNLPIKSIRRAALSICARIRLSCRTVPAISKPLRTRLQRGATDLPRSWIPKRKV